MRHTIPLDDWIPVPRLWEGETVIIVASGPSFDEAQREAVMASGLRTIVVNNMWAAIPTADLLYAADGKWWRSVEAPTAEQFQGLRVTPARDVPGSHRVGVEHVTNNVFSDDPRWISNGRNSGFQAIGLARHLGVRRIILVGFDMKPGNDKRLHSHPDHATLHNPTAQEMGTWRGAFANGAASLKGHVDVVNCSPGTALTCFERGLLIEAIARTEKALQPVVPLQDNRG